MSARPGIVYLVGAGPGDPGLMTARALELIAAADVVLYDRLIPPGALDGPATTPSSSTWARRRATTRMEQAEIEALMVERARAGRSVVRLKGGDPFVFGRGGEEAEALARGRASPSRSCPGVTAGVAAPAYAGIPVTHRDDASAVAFVTGHEDPEKPETALDWEALARFPGTLVLYMGVKNLPRDRRAPGRGRARSATSRRRRSSAALSPTSAPSSPTLAKLPGAVAADAGLRRARRSCSSARSPRAARRSPGSSAARCTAARVVVTRARAQASGLSREPCARSAPRSSSCPRSGSSRGSRRRRCATRSPTSTPMRSSASPARTACACCSRRWPQQGRDARALANATVAAIGPGTAAALARARRDRRHRPRALRRRGAGRGARRRRRARTRPCWSPAPPRRATCSPTRCASAAREVDVVAVYETVREQPDPGGDRGGRRRPTTSPSPRRRRSRNLLDAVGDRFPRRGADRLDRPGHQRRPPAKPASRSTSRPSATTRRAWSRRCSPTRRESVIAPAAA